ncbi:hypothetical protein IEQ34_006812 [Dendrobium chrysotoxum]|uniref:Uncharacterized protein n=1 Tax=Dendrobium chrysotoxum TaxID=161865 RepID=A0AAV7H4Q2_DENCH|nr:hypothetical protein IEQ34_006812 [Dendrobium chrysotoxum]
MLHFYDELLLMLDVDGVTKILATRKWYINFLMTNFHHVVLFTVGSNIYNTSCGHKLFTKICATKFCLEIFN